MAQGIFNDVHMAESVLANIEAPYEVIRDCVLHLQKAGPALGFKNIGKAIIHPVETQLELEPTGEEFQGVRWIMMSLIIAIQNVVQNMPQPQVATFAVGAEQEPVMTKIENANS